MSWGSLNLSIGPLSAIFEGALGGGPTAETNVCTYLIPEGHKIVCSDKIFEDHNPTCVLQPLKDEVRQRRH